MHTVRILLSTCTLFFAFIANLQANLHNVATDDSNRMANSISVSKPWVRATFALAKTGAAYVSLTNTSDQPVILLSVSVSDAVATQAELHHTVMHDDMMQMQELKEGIQIDANSTVDLAPGGMHMMIMGLTGPFNKGNSVDIELRFADGSSASHTFLILDKRNN